jgi:hypothetical protein
VKALKATCTSAAAPAFEEKPMPEFLLGNSNRCVCTDHSVPYPKASRIVRKKY